VLKIGAPGDPGLRAEAWVLELLGGEGAVALLEADVAGLGALLLARAEPGDALSGVALAGADDEATRVAAEVMARLWRPVPPGCELPSVEDWGDGFARHRAAHGGGSGPLDAGTFERAERTFAELCSSQEEAVVLHGDLHHFNVLRARRSGWLAIDPKGVVGERCYEPGALLRNPYPHVPGARDTARRLDRLAAELGLDRERLRAWAFAQAVLSAVWHIEDGDEDAGHRYAMACAERIEAA
jgi:streptomycin 6-kinase